MARAGRSRWTQAALWLCLRDAVGWRYPAGPDRLHLEAAGEWLMRAHDHSGSDGVAYAYGLRRGWHVAYPETTGYLIPTLYGLAARLERPEYAERAARMARWLLGLQLECGAYPGGTVDQAPVPEVFNTGMIVFGLLAAARHTGDAAFLDAATRAGRWLAQVQDASGAWSRSSFGGIPHSYHTRVAWALLALDAAAAEAPCRQAAVRGLSWAAAQQTNNGWPRLCGFAADALPYTHTLAYALRGWLECGLLLGDERVVDRARQPADRLRERFDRHGRLSARYDEHWEARDRSSCLTGCAQLACLWLRLGQVGDGAAPVEAASRMIGLLKATQSLAAADHGIRGGIRGSLPVWGSYLPFRWPNWAAKFVADALLLAGGQGPPADPG